MAKDLTDRDQPGALPQHFTGQGMAEPVWSDPWQTGPLAGPLHHVADQISADRPAGCPAGQEQMALIGRVPTTGQVRDQRAADLGRQREPVLPTAFAADE